MSEMWTTAVAGAAAGLGVAMPVGAVGVLLVQQGMRDRRGAVAAASAVAAVDFAYAAVATALGPWVASTLAGVEAWVRLVAAGVLMVIAGRGLWGSRGPATPPGPAAAGANGSRHAPTGPVAGADGSPHAPTERLTAPGAHSPAPTERVPAPGGGHSPAPAEPATTATAPGAVQPDATPARVFVRFAALTLVNPTTALYFTALTTAQGSTLHGGGSGAVFVAAVFAASFVWQQLLVAASGFAGARISEAARTWTFRIGYGLVAAYAIKVALPLP
ncbi:hypothetical protein ABZ404_36730 [Streptomyces sp. NPDC005878]|uniref:hypothetical protein n=1 Tax=Streptomyces sp. NPDC005878 TaxID=3157077 RepID=UPI00340F0E70